MRRVMLMMLGFALGLQGTMTLADPAAAHWPQWRGPAANGVALATAKPPLRWDATTNIRWKAELPGRGVSTPVVWGDLILLTAAVQTDKDPDPAILKEAEAAMPERVRQSARLPRKIHQFIVMAFDRNDGRVRWQTTVCEEAPHAGTHPDGSWASASPVTDGEHLFVFFGSQGLYCLDLEGKVKWQKRLGFMKTRASFGEGASPLLHGDTLVVPWDHEEASFVVALDKRTGAEKWRHDRDEPTAWATPVAVNFGGKTQVVLNACNRVRSYDLATGAVIWETAGMTLNTIPTPIVMGDTVIVTSGFRGSAAFRIKLAEARGDITNNEAAFVWKYNQDTPYVPSPVLVGDRFYFLKGNDGKLTCLDAATGKPHYTVQELPGTKQVYASLVAAAGRVLVTGTEGTTHVIKEGSQFELLASNKLEDKFTASPVIAGNCLLLRGEKHLYCIAEGK